MTVKVERVIGIAVKSPDGTYYHSAPEYTYEDIRGELSKEHKDLTKWEDGYITNKYNFWSKKQAGKVDLTKKNPQKRSKTSNSDISTELELTIKKNLIL